MTVGPNFVFKTSFGLTMGGTGVENSRCYALLPPAPKACRLVGFWGRVG